MNQCRRCQSPLDQYGLCSLCQIKGFRDGCPTVELNEGLEVKKVLLKRSPDRSPVEMTLEKAIHERLVYAEKVGHGTRVYILSSRSHVIVGPRKET